MRAASARFLAPTFWIAADRWLRTVPSESTSRVGDLGDRAAVEASARTSRSRSDSGLAPSLSAASGERRVHDPLAARDAPDRRGELGRRRVLEHEPRRAGLHRAAQVARPPERREDHDPAAGQRGRSWAAAASPSSPGISMSRSATSGRSPQRRRDDLVAAADLGHDLEVALQLEQGGERAADHRLVLGEQQRITRRRRAAIGTRPGAGTRRRQRPRLHPAAERAARSRRPASPVPRRAPGTAGAGRVRRPVVDDPSAPAPSDPDRRRARVAVAQDVGDALADRPAEHASTSGGRPSGAGSTLASIPAACEGRPGRRPAPCERRPRGTR